MDEHLLHKGSPRVMRGSITKRGKRSWRLKYDVERIAGKRQTRYATFKGTRKDAEAELARLVNSVNAGTHVDPSKHHRRRVAREVVSQSELCRRAPPRHMPSSSAA